MLNFLPRIRQAVGKLRRTPGFTLLCVLTLSVGIGANTAIFSVVNGILLSPLPYHESERLVGLWHTAPGLNLQQIPMSDGTYLLYREGARVFEGIALYRESMVNLTGGETPERAPAAEVTASLFPVLQSFPRVGRAFMEEEEQPGAQPVVVLSDRLWKRRFDTDPQIRDKTIRIDGIEHEVIGVMPPGFEFPSARTELWLPMAIDPANVELGSFNLYGIGRISEEVSITEAKTDLNRLLIGLEQIFPGPDAPLLAEAGFAVLVHQLRDDVVGDVGNTLWILLGAVGFILLIACANVANLLIVRIDARRRETAIYTALGASRGRLISDVLAESLVLGLAAGVVGLFLAYGGLRFLLYLRPINLPRLEEVGIDGWVLAFTAAIAILASILFGLLPAYRATLTEDLATELRGGGRTMTMGRARRRSRQLLVGVQIALALVLLTGSGLMLRSFLRLSNLHPGFEAAHVLSLQLALPATEYPDDASAARFFQEIVERLAALPGVVSVGATSSLPLSGTADATEHAIEDHPAVEQRGRPPILWYEYVTEDYFQSMGIPLLEGRTLERADHEHRAGVAVVNETLAKRYWPNESALGKRLRPVDSNQASDPWYTVVGVVVNVRTRQLTEEPDEIVYYPLLGRTPGEWTARQMSVVLRVNISPESVVGAVRNKIWSQAPNLPIARVQTMEQLVRQARARMNFTAVMFLIATAVALTLAGVGIYGFVSYMVNQRKPEIGMRVAIGARPGVIRWMIVKEAISIAVIGMVVGFLGSLALTRWLQALLFEVSALDPIAFGVVPLLLLALVVLASYLPANRAARVDPVKALQQFHQ